MLPEPTAEIECVEWQIIWVSYNDCVNMKVLVKAAPLESNSVNVLGWVNVLENMFNSINAINFVNMSVGGMYSSIVVPLDAFKSPNVSL